MNPKAHPRHRSLIWDHDKNKWALRITKERSSRTCQVSWCKNPPRVTFNKQGKTKTRSICNKCASRLYRANNPIRYAYENLKDSARKRKISFELSFEQFKEWCKKTGYALGKGQQRLTDHCDRIKDSEGYHIDNIQVLPQGENVRKQRAIERKNKWLMRNHSPPEEPTKDIDNDDPF